jgi:hypothetical protein
MAHGVAPRRFVGFVVGLREHVYLVSVGLVLIGLGLSVGVARILPPAGLMIGLVGFVMFAVGATVRMDRV